MTNIMNRVLMTAALAAAVAGTAWAGEPLKANIPFAFSAGGTKLPAGEYTIGQHDPHFQGVIAVRNKATGDFVLAHSAFPITSGRDDNRLVFRCGEHGCALTQVWNGTSGLEFKPRVAASSEDRVAVVPMRKGSASGSE
jgi:hypothetical protein